MSSPHHSAFCFSLLFPFVCALSLAAATLEGTAYLPDGRPAEGAVVRIRPVDFIKDTSLLPAVLPDPGKIKDTTTGTNGAFRLDSIDRGLYNIELIHGNNGYATDSIFLEDNKSSIFPACTLKPPGVIRGKVEPVDLSIGVFVAVQGFDRLVRTDSSGMFSMVLPPGKYVVKVFGGKGGFIASFIRVAISSDRTTDIEIQRIQMSVKRPGFSLKHEYYNGKNFQRSSSFTVYNLTGRTVSRRKGLSKGIYLTAVKNERYLTGNTMITVK